MLPNNEEMQKMTTNLEPGKTITPGVKDITLVVCQCGSAKFVVRKQLKDSVAITCVKCKGETTVKGNIAFAPVDEGAISVAVTEKVIGPSGISTRKKKEVPENEKPKTLGEQGFRQFRFRIGVEASKTVQRALEVIRVMNYGQEEYQQTTWQGFALEAMAADFIAGADPRAVAIVDAQDEAVAAAAEKAKKELTQRQVRDIRRKTREDLASKMHGEEEAPEESEEAAQDTEDGEDTQVFDHGRLERAVQAGINDIREQTRVGVGTLQELKGMWEKNGGYLLRVDGDERTVSSTGQRPHVYFWMKDEAEAEFELYYDEEMEKKDSGGVLMDAAVSVVELVPAGYSKFETKDKWQRPAIAHKREEMASE